jgi:hypothetical protein
LGRSDEFTQTERSVDVNRILIGQLKTREKMRGPATTQTQSRRDYRSNVGAVQVASRLVGKSDLDEFLA